MILPGIFIEFVLYASGNFLVADVEEVEISDASEIHGRTFNAKEVLKPKNGE